MKLTLRKHQAETIDEINSSIMFGSNRLMVSAPPAFGKSLVMSEIAAEHKDNGVMILINITALLDQIAKHLSSQGVEYSILKADRPKDFDPDCKVQLVMSQTLHARIKKDRINFKHKMSIIQQDEGHRENRMVSQRTKECYDFIKPDVEILYSGTPYDSLGFKFKDYEYINTKSVQELQDDGFLCPIKYYVPKWAEQIDYSKIKTSGADYNTVELDKLISTKAHLSLALGSMNELGARDKKTLVFCSNIEQADMITEILVEDGYLAESFHSKTENSEAKMKAFLSNTYYVNKEDRQPSLFEGKEAIDSVKKYIKCFVSVNRLGIGFDCPDVELGVQLRPTKVRALYIQTVSRLSRTHKDKEFAQYLDIGQTVSNFGFHTDDYNPPLMNIDKETNRINLEDAAQSAPSDLVATLSNNLEEITRESYNIKLEVIKNNLKKDLSSLSIEELAAAFDVSNDHKEIITIACLIYTFKFGRPVSKSGYEYDYKPSNFWSKTTFGKPEFHVLHDMQWYFDKVPDMKRQWNKALKTRARNIIKEQKGLFQLTGFIKYMYEKYQEENSSFEHMYNVRQNEKANEFVKNIDEKLKTIPDIEINDEDIPF